MPPDIARKPLEAENNSWLRTTGFTVTNKVSQIVRGQAEFSTVLLIAELKLSNICQENKDKIEMLRLKLCFKTEIGLL